MKHLRYLNKFLWKYKWRLSLGVLFVIAQNYFRLLVPPQFRKALDLASVCLGEYRELVDPQEKAVLLKYIGLTLLDYAWLVILFSVIMGVFMYFMRQTIIVVSRLIEYDLRKEIFEHYEILDSNFYTRHSTGDLMSRITEDVSKVRMYLGPGLLYCINLVTLLVIAVVYMYSINAKLTLYALAPLPILSYSIYYVSSIINSRSVRIQKQLARLTSIAQEVYSGIRVVKSYAKESQFQQFFKEESETFKTKSMDMARVNAFFYPIMILLVSISILLVVVVGAQEVAKGNITHGIIAEFIIYVNMLTWPFTALGWIVSIVQEAEASQGRINEFRSTKPEIINEHHDQLSIHGSLEFRNVTYTYPDSGTRALKNVSFKVAPGEKLGIIGRTASGKSTVASLILRMMDVSSGEVLIDNKNVKDLSLFSLRRRIAYVPQDVFLFSDTISNNINFGVDENDPEKVAYISRQSAVYEDIMGLPNQFETILGERGVTLSGGQKQRVSLARALIKDPDLVILDDCLSAVDTTTEQTILGYLNDALKDKTSIIITHRIYKSLIFDKVIVLEEGEILEYGTPEELIAREGYYYDILNKQLSEDTQEVLESDSEKKL